MNLTDKINKEFEKELFGTTCTQSNNNTSSITVDDMYKLIEKYKLNEPRVSKIEANYNTILKFKRLIKTIEKNKLQTEFGMIVDYERILGIPVWENNKIINNYLECYDQYDKLLYVIILLEDKVVIADIKKLNECNRWLFEPRWSHN